MSNLMSHLAILVPELECHFDGPGRARLPQRDRDLAHEVVAQAEVRVLREL